MKKLTNSCITVLIFMNLAAAQQAKQMSASEIMDRVAAVYSSCRSYSDEGKVSVEFISDGTNVGSGVFVSGAFRQPRVQPFFTAFVRPASFRFEVWSRRGAADWDRLIAWKEGNVEKAWWSLNQHEAPLGKTLRSFVGLSRSSAQTVPQLLLPALFPAESPVTSLEDLRLTGKDKIDGRATFKIEGKHEGETIKLWIDSSEFLILKIYQEEKRGSLKIQTTTTYKPQVNVDVARDLLAFNPPSVSPSFQMPAAIDGPTFSSGRSTSQNQEKTKPNASDLSLAPKAAPKKEKPKKKGADQASNQKETIIASDEDDIVRVDTTLVSLDVLALDKQGDFIKGLTGKDFVVTEDGQPQQVTTFALGDDITRPRTIILIIDYSGSQLPFIKTSVEAAKTLVDQLNPKDRMAIVTDDVSLLVDFTQDKTELKTKLDSLWKAVAKEHRLGLSAQYSALMATFDRLSAEADVHPIIIFQTDGDELPYLSPVASYPPPVPMTAPGNEKKFSIIDVFTEVVQSKATIYTVIPGIRLVGLSLDEQLARARRIRETENAAVEKLRPDMYKRQRSFREKNWSDEDWQNSAALLLWVQKALATLSQISGGWADYLEQADQAADIYSRILSDINRRYIVGYQPTNKARDGKLRKVIVEVRGHPEYTVSGRKSYYAPVPER